MLITRIEIGSLNIDPFIYLRLCFFHFRCCLSPYLNFTDSKIRKKNEEKTVRKSSSPNLEFGPGRALGRKTFGILGRPTKFGPDSTNSTPRSLARPIIDQSFPEEKLIFSPPSIFVRNVYLAFWGARVLFCSLFFVCFSDIDCAR